MTTLHYFDPQPAPSELPARLPSPFAHAPPHPLARRAADQLLESVRRDHAAGLDAPGGGKMFGVLVVVAPDRRVGYLRAFSGMLGGRWEVDGFVPPLFDPVARDTWWPAGEDELDAIAELHHELVEGPAAVELRAQLATIAARHRAAVAELAARHRASRADRHERRRDLGASSHDLDQQSRADAAARRQLRAAHAAELEHPAARQRELDERRRELERARADRSRQLWSAIHDGYVIANARGERRRLGELFAPNEPPGGAGDCAAPKLLGHAYREQLRPLALAELWWGAPPAAGGRHAGVYYPSCRRLCGVILPHMLDGLAVEPAPELGAAPIAPDEPRAVFEACGIVVVDKPCGLLSVPGRSGALRDSVLVRLRERYPDATGPMLVHRLDLDTSGLLLATTRPELHAALQRLFARREIDKRYVAWLDGEVPRDHGVIELPLRVDLDDRPRQIVDPIHGKRAITEWRVVERDARRTKVIFTPRTGRTHQLRVHASHPDGLAAPIVGDRLYGRAGARLMLHALSLGFDHPATGERIEVSCPAPF